MSRDCCQFCLIILKAESCFFTLLGKCFLINYCILQIQTEGLEEKKKPFSNMIIVSAHVS